MIVTVNCSPLSNACSKRIIWGTHQRRKRVPRQECHHEAQPRKEEDPSIRIQGIQYGDRSCFMITWIDFRGDEEQSQGLRSHVVGCSWRSRERGIVEMYSGLNQHGTNIRGLLVYELSGISHHIDVCLMNILTHAPFRGDVRFEWQFRFFSTSALR